MLSFKINNVPTLFIRGYVEDDTDIILQFVESCQARGNDTGDRILFIDTPATQPIVAAVRELKANGFRVFFRDHHGLEHEPKSLAERKKFAASTELKRHLKEDCVITTRTLHPACSSLVEIGEFQDAVAIIADPDADGLTAATKAAGIFYPELDEDAAKLDGEPSLHMTGTPMATLLAKGIAVLPKIDPRNPESRDKYKQQLFARWVQAVQGNADAREKLEGAAVAYDTAVQVAEKLSQKAVMVAPGVVLVDVQNALNYDEGSLTVFLEKTPGCRITVIRKAIGPIAALLGVQYSLAVAKGFQKEIDLRRFLPDDIETGPKAGAISNVSFLLHVSEDNWKKYVLKAAQSSAQVS